jgi:Ca2+-binding EF-hand superfamily protein
MTREEFTKMIMDLSKHVPELKGVEKQEIEAGFSLFVDGGLSFANFRYWWRSSHKFDYFTGQKAVLLRKAWGLYRKYALRGSQIDLESFMKMLDDLKIKGSEEDFDKLDVDDNGLLSFKEFTTWLKWF